MKLFSRSKPENKSTRDPLPLKDETDPAQATMEQLEAISSDPAFVMSQLQAKATILDALYARISMLEAEVKRSNLMVQSYQNGVDEPVSDSDAPGGGRKTKGAGLASKIRFSGEG